MGSMWDMSSWPGWVCISGLMLSQPVKSVMERNNHQFVNNIYFGDCIYRTDLHRCHTAHLLTFRTLFSMWTYLQNPSHSRETLMTILPACGSRSFQTQQPFVPHSSCQTIVCQAVGTPQQLFNDYWPCSCHTQGAWFMMWNIVRWNAIHQQSKITANQLLIQCNARTFIT